MCCVCCCAALIGDAAMSTAVLLLYAGVLPYKGFHTDTEALYGVGDRGRKNRSEIIRFRLFFNNRINGFEMSGYRYGYR